MLDQRLRRWYNIEPVLDQRLMFSRVTSDSDKPSDLIG